MGSIGLHTPEPLRLALEFPHQVGDVAQVLVFVLAGGVGLCGFERALWLVLCTHVAQAIAVYPEACLAKVGLDLDDVVVQDGLFLGAGVCTRHIQIPGLNVEALELPVVLGT